jgi:hypothetical protein
MLEPWWPWVARGDGGLMLALENNTPAWLQHDEALRRLGLAG